MDEKVDVGGFDEKLVYFAPEGFWPMIEGIASDAIADCA